MVEIGRKLRRNSKLTADKRKTQRKMFKNKTISASRGLCGEILIFWLRLCRTGILSFSAGMEE